MTREEAVIILDGFKHNPLFNEQHFEAFDMAISALTENKGDLISRQSLKQKLQKHHDFFIGAYGGFSNLPQNDKSRVDEITNCIAMVVNEPSVTIPSVENKGEWVFDETLDKHYYCSECKSMGVDYWDYCPYCGAKMKRGKSCRCNTCKNNDDELSGECYECVKGIFDHYEPEEIKMEVKHGRTND